MSTNLAFKGWNWSLLTLSQSQTKVFYMGIDIIGKNICISSRGKDLGIVRIQTGGSTVHSKQFGKSFI